MKRFVWMIAGAVGLGLMAGGAAFAAAEPYQPGGSLMGVPLPLYPTQHGEPAGHPGCIPSLQTTNAKGTVEFTVQGQAPERLLYDGSVEHYRNYWFKYCPVKSFFDRQSLIKNWLAPDISGVQHGQVENYAEPVYWVGRFTNAQPTGRFNKPVPVVRCKVGTPVFSLDLGTLPVGLYAVRVIGAVETKSLLRHRKPLVLKLTVNDGINGETSSYRFRCRYVDEFYAVAEFYFHAPVKRAYQATVSVDDGSLVDLLVHNIDLHDALAGTIQRAIKTKATLNPPVANVHAVTNDAARLERDAMFWNDAVPLNAQIGYSFGGGGDDGKENWPNIGAGGLTPEQIKEQWGEWTLAPRDAGGEAFLVDTKLKLTYSMSDYRAGRPLPDPYPFKDRGTGVWMPPVKEGEKPQNWFPIAHDLWERMRRREPSAAAIQAYREKGDMAAGRDAAVMLCRIAYDAPAWDTANFLGNLIVEPGPYGRDYGCRRRCSDEYGLSNGEVALYDQLFDLIKADTGLAESIHRFIPWIHTPQDVIKLLDVYLVQTVAKREMRYHWTYANEPTILLTPVICLGDNSVTDDWMNWLFTSAFLYPNTPSGLQDLLITGNDRDGIGYIGSFFYSQGEQCAPKVADVDRYLAKGGNPKFDLADPKRFPKPIAACYWFFNTRHAGLAFPRIGDVTGPDKAYGSWFDVTVKGGQYLLGWRWTKDPKFAFVLKNYAGRQNETDAEWAEIEQAAAKVQRAPWLDERSRMVPNWFGLLETGTQYDDFRFRRDVLVRIGQGWGHQHSDTLDLQFTAHGYPMTIDGGQRGGYSSPGDRNTYVHNLVFVDHKNWLGHSWINTLSDGDGARYLSAQAEPPATHPEVTLRRRQVALLDVDEGRGAKSLTLEQLRPETKLDPDVVTPNSYIFDVVRVAGGTNHTYCFHGPIEDQLTCNVPGIERCTLDKPASTGAAPAGDVVEATWQMTRAKCFGNETDMASGIWNEKNPRKETRLHLLGQNGARVRTAILNCKQWHYTFSNLYVEQDGKPGLESVFPAIIEPYVGQPFLAGMKLLPVADNDADAQRAVAVEVKTVNGHTDLCFADGRPEKRREVRGQRSGVSIAGEFAYVSTDSAGLRVAALTGGTLLETPEVTITTAQRERTGKITKVNYLEKTFTIDQAWSGTPLVAGSVFEVGVPGHMTGYTMKSAKAGGKTTDLTVTEGADFYSSRVEDVNPETRTVKCALAIPHTEKIPCPGVDKHWVASNEAMTKFWRADYQGIQGDEGWSSFHLDGPVTDADFGSAGGLRLWEYGVGDTVRQSTFVSLHRTGPQQYEVQGNVDAEIKIGGKTHQISAVEFAKNGGRVRLTAAR